MTSDQIARNRWLALVAIRIVTAMGAVFGLIVLARAPDTAMRVLGAAIVLSALYAMAIVPRGLTAKWRSK
ncbi:hypothetical protein [uncultured Sphingomonas sp.]|jgi:uncharacterized membrane protein YfcA|uniref:hypothetical protein n=1 Tax=uncultured Sphingomonas sp. TaxID=158754 RepID=UPI00258FF512|nr:hypothetical protein [uncultured Sphingomonas sp.]